MRQILQGESIEMVIKLSILGLLIVLIAVLIVTSRKEFFVDATVNTANTENTANTVNTATTKAVTWPPPRGVVPAQSADLSQASLAPSMGDAAGPAPIAPAALSAAINTAQGSPSMGLSSPMQPVMHENNHTTTAVHANTMQNKSDLLSSIQKIIHNELLAARSTDTAIKHGAPATSHVASPSLQQGRERTKASPSHGAGCEPEQEECQDMSQYIKKDSIPCWGCSLNY